MAWYAKLVKSLKLNKTKIMLKRMFGGGMTSNEPAYEKEKV